MTYKEVVDWLVANQSNKLSYNLMLTQANSFSSGKIPRYHVALSDVGMRICKSKNVSVLGISSTGIKKISMSTGVFGSDIEIAMIEYDDYSIELVINKNNNR